MFKWKDEFSVNIKSIDDQHKQLFEIGSKIYAVALLDDSHDHYDEIIQILDELRDYTLYHFEFEEKLLEKHGWDELEHQHFQHIFFVKKLEKIGRKDIDSEQNQTALEIAQFVTDWITNHILKSDMKYKPFLNKKGIY